MFARRRRWWLVGISAALVLVGYFAFAYPSPAENEEEGDAPVGSVAVQVISVERRDVHRTTRVTARISPRLSVDLTPRVPGEVQEVFVEMGDRVEAGQALVQLDDSDLRTQQAQAEAALETARAQVAQVESGASDEEIQQLRAAVEQAEMTHDLAVRTYERIQRLYRQGVVSGTQLEEAEMGYRGAEIQLTIALLNLKMALDGAPEETLRAARARLSEAEAAVSAVRTQVDRAVIRAPVPGVVAYVIVGRGDMVSPGSGTVGLVDIDTVYVDALVSEKVVGSLRKGDTVPVVVGALSETFDAEIAQVAPAADRQTGMFPVRMSIDNPDGTLKSGMLAEVTFVTERAEDVLAVPRRAVMTRGAEHYVFIVVDDLARRRPVELGLEDVEYVEVRRGLAEDDVVVEFGAEYLEDGDSVEVIEGR